MSSFVKIPRVKSTVLNHIVTDNVLKKIEHIRHSKPVRRAAFIVALAIFVLGLIACVLSVPDLLSRIRIGPFLVVILIGVPLTLVLNAIDIILTGRLIRQEFNFLGALKISIFGTAANMLPLPGGAVVRIAALKDKGAALGEGTRATFAAGIIWLGVSLLYSGLWMLSFSFVLGVLSVFVGGTALALGVLMGLRTYGRGDTIVQIIGLKIAATLLITVKLIFCVWAVGTLISFPEAAIMTAADVIGSAVMVVPAGLGVNEGMTALLAQVAGLTAATGFLAAVTNRLATLLALCPITLYLYSKNQASGGNDAKA